MTEIGDPSVVEYLDTGKQGPVDVARAILVFGKNSATYKFALAKTLFEMDAKSEASYGELGEKFLGHLVEHHKICPHQYNRGSTRLSNAIDEYILSKISWDDLFNIAEQSIYNNVFDAFHVIGGGSINRNYVLFEHDKSRKKIVLTDNLNNLQTHDDLRSSLLDESEARWRVVEEAWRSNVSPMMILDERDKLFFTKVGDHRINLRSAVSTLMPYQFGKCFYCECALKDDLSREADQFPDVDHVLPLSLLTKNYPAEILNPNGVWNLVLSCRRCNRGVLGKSDSIPDIRFYEKLLSRNVYFTKEHKHAMRFSVLKSLGVSNQLGVRERMKEIYKPFHFLHKWSPNV